MYWIQNAIYDRTARKKLNKIKDLGLKLNYTLYSVKCETFISGGGAGRGQHKYRFRLADLYFYENALVIAGYFKIGKYKSYKTVLFLSNDNKLILNRHNIEVKTPKKVNLNSFNSDVYIEFIISNFIETIVEIRLKHLSEEEKKQIRITTPNTPPFSFS
ncbi:hypothetical protein ACF3OB_06870 [Capnocytophaga canis]|uniref:hypothetical protein n=1 Tax=Capnocytophaga canis TaxID=1848903 RepID=UPI001AD1C483|nr:hypothetical protein CAPN008_10710 [Capnocytophaga canis]